MGPDNLATPSIMLFRLMQNVLGSSVIMNINSDIQVRPHDEFQLIGNTGLNYTESHKLNILKLVTT